MHVNVVEIAATKQRAVTTGHLDCAALNGAVLVVVMLLVECDRHQLRQRVHHILLLQSQRDMSLVVQATAAATQLGSSLVVAESFG
jgi:hypothetical protein